jgi:hypothetical protein
MQEHQPGSFVLRIFVDEIEFQDIAQIFQIESPGFALPALHSLDCAFATFAILS